MTRSYRLSHAFSRYLLPIVQPCYNEEVRNKQPSKRLTGKWEKCLHKIKATVGHDDEDQIRNSDEDSQKDQLDSEQVEALQN
jgi:hypothetical protein